MTIRLIDNSSPNLAYMMLDSGGWFFEPNWPTSTKGLQEIKT